MVAVNIIVVTLVLLNLGTAVRAQDQATVTAKTWYELSNGLPPSMANFPPKPKVAKGDNAEWRDWMLRVSAWQLAASEEVERIRLARIEKEKRDQAFQLEMMKEASKAAKEKREHEHKVWQEKQEAAQKEREREQEAQNERRARAERAAAVDMQRRRDARNLPAYWRYQIRRGEWIVSAERIPGMDKYLVGRVRQYLKQPRVDGVLAISKPVLHTGESHTGSTGASQKSGNATVIGSSLKSK